MEIFTITTGTILSMFMNMTSATDNGQFAYNADMDGNKVTAIYVYNKVDDGKHLRTKCRQNYTYDEQERLARKETQTWNADKNCWEESSCITYAYNDFGVEMEYSVWSKEEMAYKKPQQRVVYNMIAGNVVGVNEYRWNEKLQDYELADNYLLMHDGMKNLLADAK